MTSTSIWSVTLTGGVLALHQDEPIWPQVATRLGMDVASLHARLPVTFKPVDEAQARHQCAELEACGAEALALTDDGATRLWIHQGERTAGPVSRTYARHALAAGTWPADVLACPHGERDWQPLRDIFGETFSPDAGFDLADTASTGAPVASSAAFASASVASTAGAVAAPTSLETTPPANTPAGDLPDHRQQPSLHGGFWMRFAAYLIDSLILSVGMFVVGFVFGIVLAVAGPKQHPGWIGLLYLLLIAGMWLYFALFESSSMQATPGKMALGLRVTDQHGQRIGFGNATGRFFGKILSGLILDIGYMMAGWTARKQALHDMMAGCCVVRAGGLEYWRAHGTTEGTTASRGMPGWAIALIIVGVCFAAVVPVAILAAIAVPAYQSYVVRAQVSEGMSLASDAKLAVGNYIRHEDGMPDNNRVAGLSRPAAMAGKYVSSVAVNQGYVVVTYGGASANSEIRGDHLVFAPRVKSNVVTWHCSSPDMKHKYLPLLCR